MTTTPIYSATLTAQNVIDAVSRETRGYLDSTVVADQTILLDYLNRTQLTVNRWTGWEFLESDWKYFLTRLEQTDYWLGTTGTATAGTVDTKLNITDLDRIKRNSVVDVSNSRGLQRMDTKPFSPSLSYRDSAFRPGRPATWRQDVEVSPNVVNIYPAPDNNNSYQPVPPTPAVAVASGSIPAGTYYVRVSYVDVSSSSESAASDREAVITLTGTQGIAVNTPPPPAQNAVLPTYGVSNSWQYRIYIGTTSGSGTLQSSGTIGTNTTVSTYTTAGAAFPTVNNLPTLGGYLISFKYYRQRQVVSATSDVLQVPNVYKDVLIAGTTWQACQYLKLKDESQYWNSLFQSGLRDMVRDRNTIPRENDFIQPDSAGLGIGNSSYIDTFEVQR